MFTCLQSYDARRVDINAPAKEKYRLIARVTADPSPPLEGCRGHVLLLCAVRRPCLPRYLTTPKRSTSRLFPTYKKFMRFGVFFPVSVF